ncbi:MAG: HAD family hydrolase [Clostridiales bacterium]|nr:HAD family hydrolase [Clostridiales bacterium]
MKNFVFDLYNTLIRIRTDEYRDETWRPVVLFFRDHGIETDVDALRTLYGEGWKVRLAEMEKTKKYKFPECDITDIFSEMASRLGGSFSRELCEEATKCMRRASRIEMSVFDGVHELFIKLRSLGAKLYLLSNAQAAFTYDEIDECGLLSRFDGMLLSSEYGCRKPDPAFFKMLFGKYGLDKRDSVMIGDDKESDGKGAKAFGISFVHAPSGAAAVADKLIKLVK